MDRTKILDEKIENIFDPEIIMSEIINVLDNKTSFPSAGSYYTFIYQAKTPRIIYDQHPLVAITSIEDWGFRGLNFHWSEIRSYTWDEIYSDLHLIYNSEISYFRNIPYAKFKIS